MSSSSFPDETTAAALQAMPDAVIAVDGEGRIRFVNSKAEELTAFLSDELVGQRIEILVPQSRRATHRRNMANYQHAPAPREMGAKQDLGLLRKDGVIVPVAISLSPLTETSENIVLSTIKDVSEQERRSKEYILLDELGALVAKEHEINKVYELLESSLPVLFEFDRLAVTVRVPGTDLAERVFVSGHSNPDDGVGSRTTATEMFGYSSRSLSGTSLAGKPETLTQAEGRFAVTGLRSWLQVPLGDPENPSGWLSLRSAVEDAFDADDLILLERVASLISPSFENARLYARVQREVQERTMLASVSRIVTSTQDLHDVFGQFADAVRELVPADRITITLMSEDGTAYIESYGWGVDGNGQHPAVYTPVAGNPMELLVAGQLFINVGDHNKAEMAARYSAIQNVLDAGSKSLAATALRYQEKVIGRLMISTSESNAYGEREIRLLEEISAQVAGAVVNSELAARLGRDAERRRTLAEIGRAVSSSLDASEFFDRFAVLAKKLIPFDSFSYADFDPDEHVVTLRYWHGFDLPFTARNAGVNATGTIVEKAVAAGQAILVAADSGRPVSDQTSQLPASVDENQKEIICVPLTSRNAIFGCLYLGSERDDVFTTEHLNLADQLADQVSGAISNARSHEAALQAEKDRADSEARSRDLERLNEERSVFLSTVSHELKTPLTSLTAFADILVKNRDSNLTERQLVQVKVMQRSARRLDVLVDDLLDVSRLERGTLTLNKQSFEVKDLIEELRTAFDPILQAKKQTLDVRYPDGEAWIDADQNRIAQLISNLLSNASKYSDRGAEIVLRLSVEKSSLSIMVEDAGIGMSEETQENLFTPFFRSDDEFTQSEPGTGLGLVISKNIAELHGGTISVSSKHGIGTTVQVSLPRRNGDTPEQ